MPLLLYFLKVKTSMFNKKTIDKILSEEKISLFIFVIFITALVSLGFWQLIRHDEKTDYIHKVVQNIKYKSINFDSMEKKDLFSKVVLKGKIDYSNNFWLYRRHPLAKNIDGAYLVVPVVKGLEKVLVILGWFSSDNKNKILDEIKNNPNILLDGILLQSEELSSFVPDNDIAKRILFTMNIDQISNILDINLGEQFIAAIDIKKPFDTPMIPITSGMMINIKNDHLGYSATWFILAFSLIFIYFLYLKKKLSEWK